MNCPDPGRRTARCGSRAEAIRKARGQMKEIEERRNAAMAAGGANPVNAAEGEMAGSTSAPLKPGAPKEE